MLGIGLVALLSANETAVQVWGDTVGLPTYTEGLPSDAPHFSILDDKYNPYYPYTTRKNFQLERTVQYWRVVHLQNEFLHCMVMPDLGGHLYRCIDLTNGHDVFHPMASVKKRDIALRGAWVTTGIELNFPVGHSWVTASPVDFSWKKGDDGSGSVSVGNTDRVEGMRWLATFVLKPHSRVLEQHVTLYNRDDARHRFYWWANAAVTLEDEHTTFVYPMNLTTAEGDLSKVDTWPVTRAGKNLTEAGGYEHALGLFALDSREPFFAVYNPKSRTGVVHYADVKDVPGKKLWTWGKDRDEWARRELSDNGTNYVEIQAGVFENQLNFGFLEPQQQKSFVEYWFPVNGMDGISRATLDATLYLSHKAGNVVIQLNANRSIPGAQLRLSKNGNAVWHGTADLDPAHPYSVTQASAPPGPLTFELLDNRGSVLLRHTENQYEALTAQEYKAQKHSSANVECNSVESCMESARQKELRGALLAASGDYERAMRRFGSQPALIKGAGRLSVLLKRYPEAIRLFQSLAAEGPLDNESAYYFGLTLARLGRDSEAREQWQPLRKDAVFGAAAGIELACVEARAGNLKGALQIVTEVVRRWPTLSRAGELEVLFLRKLGDRQQALERATYWRGIDPADSTLRVEAVLLGSTDEYLWAHLGSDPDRVISLASHYMWVHDYSDAHDLLSRRYPPVPRTETEPGAVLPQDDPLVAYYRGYCQQKLGGSPTADFEAASRMSTRFIFPNRPSSYEVLTAALTSNIGDTTAHVLLADLEMESGYTDLAAKNWDYAATRNSSYPGLYWNLAEAYLLKGDIEAAELTVRNAPSFGPGDTDVKQLLDEIDKAKKLAHTGTGGRAAVKSAQAPLDGNFARAALLNAADGNIQAATALVSQENLVGGQPADAMRDAFFEVQLQAIVAAAQSANCAQLKDLVGDFGRPDLNYPFTKGGAGEMADSARTQFFLGRSEALCGFASQAKGRWRRAAKTIVGTASPDYVFPLFARIQLAALGGEPPKPALEQALNDIDTALQNAKDEDKPALLYSQGMLLQALGRLKQAATVFESLAASSHPDIAYRARVGLRDNRWTKRIKR